MIVPPVAFDHTDPAGTIVAGRYAIIKVLGQGAFGHTFLARDRTIDRLVAIKLLDPRGTADWKAHELFEREAAVLRSLRHHGIPEVYDLLTDVWLGAPAAFLIMEYVEGVSLGQMIEAQRQLDPSEVVHLFLELLGILEYLHGRAPPILHRDIKPSNIILRPDGQLTLVDFGSVRRILLNPDESGSTVAGTYGYMPYEQYMGQATAASDLYSVGATFLHVVTGRPPRDFMTDEGRLQVPDVLPGDSRIGPIIARLLRPSPAERFANARDVRQALLSPVGVQSAAGRLRLAQHGAADIAFIASAPRAIEGPTAELLECVAPSAWDLMSTGVKPSYERGILDWLSLGFFCIVTIGILPAVFITMAHQRRRLLRQFFRDGIPAMAEIVDIQVEKIPFDEKLARVSYQFEADGRTRRDADLVLPPIADRWQAGDEVQVLYLPDRDYDSVIVSPG